MVVPVDEQEATEELHIKLRNTFLENLNSNGNYDDYEPADIERIRNDDNYCKRFIRHKKGNFELALAMVEEALKWRKSFGVKDVTMAIIPLEFFQAKAVFPYNEDKEGNPIILILVKYHKKSPEFASELRRFVIYWVELMEEQTHGGRMTVIMSCEGAGLSNLDLDLIKFLITLFRSYYPDSLAHILIYEMPWILNPAWKIIKAWLPEDFVDKIKFVNKTNLQEYVTEDNLPVYMGGTNTTEYVPPTELEMENAKNGKKVHFSHNPESNRALKGVGENGISRPNDVVITDDYTVIGGVLKISPATHLVFNPSETSTNDATITLTCVSTKPVTYKVKTNNIESYRVKPAVGILEPNASVEINVVILPGFDPQQSDKFLIMAMEVSDASLSISNINALWKSSPSVVMSDHKLKCLIKSDSAVEESSTEKSLKKITEVLSNINNRVQSLESKQSTLLFRQNITLSLTFFMMCLLVFHVSFNTEAIYNFLSDCF